MLMGRYDAYCRGYWTSASCRAVSADRVFHFPVGEDKTSPGPTKDLIYDASSGEMIEDIG
jgi:hypothetical protein